MNNFKSTKTYKSSKGFSCCFRQWKADSHCKYLHGYSLEISIQFEALNLDKRNWVVDFGGLKELEKELPNNLYMLSSREENLLQELLAIIRGMTVPEIIGNMYD